MLGLSGGLSQAQARLPPANGGPTRMRQLALFFFHFSFFLSALAPTACVRWSPPAMSPVSSGSCRSETLNWFAPQDAQHRARLDAWCAGVGQPVIQAGNVNADRSQPLPLADVAFVSWNIHVGNGDVRSFIDDLRAGKLTKQRHVRHFVLMLQEAVRAEGVPSYDRAAAGAPRISARDASRGDIIQVSRDLDLSLIYVPSMRNGNSAENPASDRGSAILSTLPLSEPIAVELPGERQRRVAIIATITLPFGGLKTLPVSVGVIHLDALGAARRLWVFWTPWMREQQVKALDALLPEGTLVLGADLNTWHGKDEPAVRLLNRRFQETPTQLEQAGLGLRVLDYLFLRAGDSRTARYEQLSQSYGSDHRPLIGWFE